MTCGTNLSVTGDPTLSGSFILAVNKQTASYTFAFSDRGKMVVSNNELMFPIFMDGYNVGFWCLVNWHDGVGGAKFGPSGLGITWYLRGVSISVSTSTPFTGVVSWDGYNWYAN